MNSFLFRFLILFLLFFEISPAQNFWNPDQTAYEHINRGGNLSQFQPSGLTSVSIDSIKHNTNPSSIRWDIPSNSGTVVLTLMVGDLDLRNKTIYSVCSRNNADPNITLFAICSNGSKFKIGFVIQESSTDFVLPVTEWHQMGSYAEAAPVGGANISALAHVTKLTFETSNCAVPMNLWIDEIKMISPRGTAAIVHFNRFRDITDSLLTPFILQKNIRANMDFNFYFAKVQATETYSGVHFKAVGFTRIKDLINNYGWSCSSHGTYYDLLPYLTPSERLEVCQLDSFVARGFKADWCFSVPKDQANQSIMKEIKDWGFYKTIRRQGYAFNELPINNPDFLRFFRPTSASAGPNLNGTPLTIAEMKNFVDSCKARKGLIILDFGTIVTDTSSLYTDVETTMLDDAKALINYTDSLNIPFITFEDLLKPDSNYQQIVQASNDYYVLDSISNNNLKVMENDLLPDTVNGTLSILTQPQYGTVQLNANGISFDYSCDSACFDTDEFTYVLSSNSMSDTAKVIVRRMNSILHAVRTSSCNPNTYDLAATISGGLAPFTYLWSTGAITDTTNSAAPDTAYITITDAAGCILLDSINLPNRWAPVGLAVNSVQCGPGIPTCYIISTGTPKWYDAATGGNLLQSGDSVYLDTINVTTTFYVAVDYGPCSSGRIEVTAEIKKPETSILAKADTNLCKNQRTTLEAVTDPGLGYQWYRDGIAIPGAITHQYDATLAGLYELIVIRPQDSCSSDPASMRVNVLDSTNFLLLADTAFCNGDSIYLTATYNPTYTYNWYRNDTLIAGVDTNQIIVSDEATYQLKIQNVKGCIITSDSIKTTFNCTVGLNQPEKDLSEVQIIPNPSTSNSELLFYNYKKQNVIVDLKDITGKLIYELLNNEMGIGIQHVSINKSNLQSGIYLITIRTTNSSITKKLMFK